MRVLCTFPGKFGDLLWALPTIRAISRRVGEPVDLLIAKAFGSIAPLIELQPYIEVCMVDMNWQTQDTAPISPRLPHYHPDDYDLILHLGYRSWPLPDVVRHTLQTANAEPLPLTFGGWLTDQELQLDDPWITLPPDLQHRPQVGPILACWTDEHFELKYGVTKLLEERLTGPARRLGVALITNSPRWNGEAGFAPTPWIAAAQWIGNAQVVLADCSAYHVLACAMGKPVVVMEPAEARWNPVFYPLGQDGPRVTLVKGTNHLPTFDSRHVAETLERVLAARSTPMGDAP